MVEKAFVAQQGIWLKGNLHSHSTVSDGNLHPESVIRAYADKGYDFLSLTDHNVYTQYEDYQNLLMIPGFELTCYLNQKRVHLNFIQRISSTRFAYGQQFDITTPEQTIALIEELKNEYWIMLNHPDWSLLEYRDIENFNCFSALEVLNYGTERYDRVGRVHTSGIPVSGMASGGLRLPPTIITTAMCTVMAGRLGIRRMTASEVM